MSKDETKIDLTKAQPIETVGDLRSVLECFADNCKITDLSIFYIPPCCGEPRLEVHLPHAYRKIQTPGPEVDYQKLVEGLCRSIPGQIIRVFFGKTPSGTVTGRIEVDEPGETGPQPFESFGSGKSINQAVNDLKIRLNAGGKH